MKQKSLIRTKIKWKCTTEENKILTVVKRTLFFKLFYENTMLEQTQSTRQDRRDKRIPKKKDGLK